MFWSPIRNLANFYNKLTTNITAAERIFDIIDTEAEIVDQEGAKELPELNGKVEFKNVSFAYSDEPDRLILSDVNFLIKPGETIALVGPTGAGKTTIVNLISRFYEATEGKILIDGHEIKEVTLNSLRSQMGIMTQDNFLFSGTVFENIEYGHPGASREAVYEAAKLAGAHEFILGLKDGYDTYVGERGVKLSGGQKQRISIARVFLKNPPVLILDEATSALDNESEHLVSQSLERLSSGRTTLTIAHRLTTIQNADRILVLSDSRIIEEGSHEELLAKQGMYYQLYTSVKDTGAEAELEE